MNQDIEKFIKGTQFVKVVAPVTSKELTEVRDACEDYLTKKCIKFIPASGAATRMFKDLYQYLDDHVATDFINNFFDNLEGFAFYKDIKGFIESSKLDKETVQGKTEIIKMILDTRLCYGSLPKALIKMHTYNQKGDTPIDEHIYEGEEYLNANPVTLHFTISKDHEDLFMAYTDEALVGKDQIEITYSFQKKITDTLAVDMDNKPFVDDSGHVLYRAGGHGSLIENLNDLDGDIIFIKNIDNVCHRDHVAETVNSKKMLASVGFKVKQEIDQTIQTILDGDHNMDEIASFIKETLNIDYKKSLTADVALSLLNRPLRVCGMVKNQGEPGGGPFIVDNGDYTDLQICEKSEIDLKDPVKVEVLNQSQFFNPVDLICFVKDYKQEKFDLLDYTNKDRYFISEKTYKGRQLKALEHPGLWNGAMHNWNTLFVEVPLITFNPVKTVNDLMREGHREKV